MRRAFVSLKAVAGREGPQNPGPPDSSWRECARQLSRGRMVYSEAERRGRVKANRHPVLRTAFPHYQHSRLEFFRSFGRTVFFLEKRRPPRLRVVQRAT